MIIVTLLLIFSFLFSSCYNEVEGDIFSTPSKIWVNAVIGTDDTVKVFLGVTSGMNSGVTAKYRDDATVNLYVNDSDIPKRLVYKRLNSYKGFYFYPRLSNAKPGDSLRFTGWIEGENYEKIEAKTYIPLLVEIDSIKLSKKSGLNYDKMKINLELGLDTVGIKDNRYFELNIRNIMYMDDPKIPVCTQNICALDNLILSYGMYWMESRNSILIDYSLINDDRLLFSFNIKDNYNKNSLELKLKTITKDYFDYIKAIDNGTIVNSNIANGSGIFTGYSESVKTLIIE